MRRERREEKEKYPKGTNVEGCRKKNAKDDCDCLITSAWTDFERDALFFLGVHKRVRFIACIIDLHSHRTFNVEYLAPYLRSKNFTPIFHVYWNIKQLYLILNTVLCLRFRETTVELFDKLSSSSKFEKTRLVHLKSLNVHWVNRSLTLALQIDKTWTYADAHASGTQQVIETIVYLFVCRASIFLLLIRIPLSGSLSRNIVPSFWHRKTV